MWAPHALLLIQWVKAGGLQGSQGRRVGLFCLAGAPPWQGPSCGASTRCFLGSLIPGPLGTCKSPLGPLWLSHRVRTPAC